jgi:hypothetical protein
MRTVAKVARSTTRGARFAACASTVAGSSDDTFAGAGVAAPPPSTTTPPPNLGGGIFTCKIVNNLINGDEPMRVSVSIMHLGYLTAF